MKKVLLSAVVLLSVGTLFAQSKNVNKAFNEAKIQNPNFDEAVNLINEALENPETKDLSKTWYVAGFVQNKLFESERNKQFINKKPDENKMYNALNKSYDFYIKAYDLDNMPNEKGKIKPKYSKEIVSTLKNNQNYYINGGSFYYDKKDYRNAYDMFAKYVDINQNPRLKPETLAADVDSLNNQIMFYKAVAASLIPDSELAIAAYNDLKGKNYQEVDVYKYLSTEYLNVKDSANFAKTLEEGALKFPNEEYFVQTLINVYLSSENYDQAVIYLDKAISQDQNNAQFYDLKGKILETQKKTDEALAAYKKALEIDPNYADSWANIGIIYYNQAVDEQDKASTIKDTKAYNKAVTENVTPKFKEALPFIEKAYELNPSKREYLVALRAIYYNLRMGDEYEKIDALINSAN